MTKRTSIRTGMGRIKPPAHQLVALLKVLFYSVLWSALPLFAVWEEDRHCASLLREFFTVHVENAVPPSEYHHAQLGNRLADRLGGIDLSKVTRRPEDLLNEALRYDFAINDLAAKIQAAGGYSSRELIFIRKGMVIEFPDGRRFAIERYIGPAGSFRRYQLAGDPSSELMLAKASRLDPTASVIGSITSNPQKAAAFVQRVSVQLPEGFPLRRVKSVSEDGLYIETERFPDFQGEEMSIRRLYSDPNLSAAERRYYGATLPAFFERVHDYRDLQLNIPEDVVFDSRMDTWQLVLVTPSLHRLHPNRLDPQIPDGMEGIFLNQEEFITEADPEFGKSLRAQIREAVSQRVLQLRRSK